MKEACLRIKGMHCTGCSSRLEKVLNNLDGVKAQVSFEDKKAIVEYDDTKTSLDDIKEAIVDAGFEYKE